MRNPVTQLLLATALCMSVSPAVFGQAATDTSKGTIVVVVRDSSGGSIAGSKVTVSGGQGTINGVSDQRGEASFPTLPPNNYTVKVSKDGFTTAQINEVPVQATKVSTLPVVLQAGAVTTTVEVSDASDVVDLTSTTVESNLNAAELKNLPVARNITSLFYLAPGVASGGGTGTANPSISGASGLENQYIIDGINNTDSGYGGFGVYSESYGSLGSGVNFDFVKEIQVKTGGFEAQYGQALGGIINVVTDSGGNKIHGSAYAYSSPQWSEASYYQVNTVRTGSPNTEVDGRRQYDFGANMGGKFIKDKLFWYGSFNPSWNYTARNAPVGYTIRANGPFDVERRSLNWVGKLNYNITDSHRLEATAFGDPSTSPSTVQGSLLRNNLESASSLDFGTRNWATKYSGSFGPKTLVAASFAWNHSYFTEVPNSNNYEIRDYTQPITGSLYTLRGSTGYLSNNDGNNKQYNVMITRSVSFLGSHQIDLGYSYNDVTYDALHLYSGAQFALPSATGIATADVGKLVNGGFFYEYANRVVAGVTYPLVYRLIRGNFSNPSVSTDTGYQDAFLQDAWQVNRFLTIKAGVRWEQQKLSGNVNNYTMGGNWAPRIGFIVDPFGKGKTKLFANWGYFYEKIPQDLAVRALSTESSYLNGYFFGTAAGPTLTAPVPGTTFSPVGVDPTIIYGGTKAAYQQEVAVGVEQQLPWSMVVRASFTDRTLKRGLEDTSGITVEQALAGAPQQYVITNPNVHSDIFHNPIACVDGTSNCTNGSGYTDDSSALGADGKADGFPDMRRVYNSFQISLDKRFAKGWSLTSNYRLAKLFGNYEGSFRNDNGQSDPNITSLFDFINSPALADQFKVGVLPTDRRHIINVYTNYLWRAHFNFGVGYTSQSGTPISEFDAHPAYGNAGEIPVGGRGIFGRTPWQNYFDVRAGYDHPLHDTQKIRVTVDLFNIFNKQTTTDIDQNHQLSGAVPNPDFLKPIATHRPFRAQFSLRYEF